MERLFGELDERQLKRLAVNSVSQLIHAIDTYLEHRNEDPTPFVWTKSAQEILTKIHRGLNTLEALQLVGFRGQDHELVAQVRGPSLPVPAAGGLDCP